MIDNGEQTPEPGPVDPDSLPIDPDGASDRGGPGRRGGQEPPDRDPQPERLRTPEEWYDQFFPDEYKETINQKGFKEDFLKLYTDVLIPHATGIDEESENVRQSMAEIFERVKDDEDIRDIFEAMPGIPGEAGRQTTMWEDLEESTREPEQQPEDQEKDFSEDPESETRRAERLERARGIEDALRAAAQDPGDPEKLHAAEHAIQHIREHDGEFAKKLQKESPWYYKIIMALLVVFYIYVGLQSMAASATTAYAEGSKK